MKVLLVSPEVEPFAKTGGLADVAGTLPVEIAKRPDIDVRIAMPLYKMVDVDKFSIKKIVEIKDSASALDLEPFDLYSCEHNGVTVYFIRKDEFFYRDELYCTPQGDYPDNAARFSFFSKAVLASCKAVDFHPDIIHTNDWQTALIPFYLKFKVNSDNFFQGIKTLFSIHNIAYQGLFEKGIMPRIGIPDEFFTTDGLEFYGKISFIKSGILYSDAVNTVSEKYSQEILTEEYGAGLDGVLRIRKENLYGIFNGVDYSQWNPQNDTLIPVNYDADSLENKLICKKELLKEMGLPFKETRPLIGMVTRLAEQKGTDIVAEALADIAGMDMSLVLLGKGAEELEKFFTSLAEEYKENLAVRIAFDNKLAHMIEAGADMFLMPSRYEPCGLNQMYSLKYGTIPVVCATGGLDDTIVDYNQNSKEGNGFKFKKANKEDMLDALKRARAVFENKVLWNELVKRGMMADFSWEKSAEEYVKLYRKIISS